eukprot:CAMPEP_0194136558 /NCGR_PEP_ID=MMETSP0152-20130528/6569_1 /TAXON_ID=1049557 /ORGANISM="Thalassiothrix antarctica, Strain L6-D1" /LENGTH=747 /DNA_ID=CAMNT_0038833269 /DNA_START=72 /DNA_END=2315 /DNA_ORIENTATION=+
MKKKEDNQLELSQPAEPPSSCNAAIQKTGTSTKKEGEKITLQMGLPFASKEIMEKVCGHGNNGLEVQLVEPPSSRNKKNSRNAVIQETGTSAEKKGEKITLQMSLPQDSIPSSNTESIVKQKKPGAFSVTNSLAEGISTGTIQVGDPEHSQAPSRNDDDDGYVIPEAQLVENTIIIAEQVPQAGREAEKKKRRKKILFILVILCAIVIGVSVPLLNQGPTPEIDPPPPSKSLASIGKRGILRCGTVEIDSKDYFAFEKALCQSFASAIKDSNSFELIKIETRPEDSFTRLRDGDFDLLFTARYTAEHEIFEPFSQSTFYFASLPYLMIGNKSFTIATNSDDRVWSNFISWVFESLIQAEESNITKNTAQLMRSTPVFGLKYENIFRNGVQANGNYGEIWEKTMAFERSGRNLINDGSSGLLFAFPFGNVTTAGAEPKQGGTIQAIINRGLLNCGMTFRPGFAMFNVTTQSYYGFEVDLCRGIAAALFNGEDGRYEVMEHIYGRRFGELDDKGVDIAFGFTHTLERTINEISTEKGYDFSPSYIHDGLGFAGIERYTRCAESKNFTGYECEDTKICVMEESTWYEIIENIFKAPNIVASLNTNDYSGKFKNGRCNVIAGETPDLSEVEFRKATGYNGEYYVGKRKFSKEPAGVVTRSDDLQFSKLIKWIIYGLFYAERRNISEGNALEMPSTQLFGDNLSGIFQESVRAIGNYGSIYERNFESILPRKDSKNLLNTGGPLLLANPGTA